MLEYPPVKSHLVADNTTFYLLLSPPGSAPDQAVNIV
jgi:hypothetical protein